MVSLNQDDTLTFTVSDSGIKNYNGSNLTDEIRVTATTESLTAIPSAPLTEATLDNSRVTLTLRGRTFESNIRSYVSVSGISRVSIGNVKLLSNTEVEVTLQFSGSFDSDETLTFRVRSGGIKNYNGSDLHRRGTCHSNCKNTDSPWLQRVTTPGRTPPRPTEVASPSRWAFRIRNPTPGVLYIIKFCGQIMVVGSPSLLELVVPGITGGTCSMFPQVTPEFGLITLWAINKVLTALTP